VRLKRKGISLLLALVLLAGTVLGCSSPGDDSNDAAGGTGGKGKKVKFSYLRPTWGPATYTKGGAYEKQLFEEANVEIDVQIVPVIEFDAKINTILAGGDIPDVIWANGPVVKRDRELQEQGAFLPINKYLDMYPAVRKAVPEGIWQKLQDAKGDIYFIPNLIYPIVPFELYYRKDWFDKLGIPEPTTTQEFVAALEKIKDSDPDGNGKKDTIPFTMGYEWSFKDLGTAFGFSQFSWEPSPEDPNKLIPWFMKDKEINSYFWMQDLHKRGLLDPEFKVNAEPNFAGDKFKAGKAAVLPNHWAGYVDTVTKLQKVDPNAEVGIMSPLKGPDGQVGGNRSVFPMDRGFYVSAKAKDPDGFFRFLNWTLTDGSGLRRYGVEGKMYTLKDGKKIPIPDADRENDYKGPQLEPLRFIDPMSEKLDWEATALGFEGAGMSDKFDYVKKKFEEYAKTDYPDYRDPTVATPYASEKGSKLWNDYMQQLHASVIINHNVTKEQWIEAVEKWKKAGGDKILEEQNELQKDKSKPNYLN
jgi:putative aldouronate transport system substrate-binding protein